MKRALVIALVFSIWSSCASHQAELGAAYNTLNAAVDGYKAYDDAHQADLVKNATSLEDGKAKLAADWAAQAKVEASFLIAYKALYVATSDPSAPNLAVLAADVLSITHDLEALGVKIPGAASPTSPTPPPTP